jgi:glycosyltransferase involved in cell wall biosynthesis
VALTNILEIRPQELGGAAGILSISISIIIPAHNSGQRLRLCLTALFDGSELPLQVIVVDDGSSDDTGAVAAAFPVLIHTVERRKGPAFARNLGANLAGGDIALFLDSDVCVRRDTVKRVRESFEKDPELDALIGSYDSKPQCPEFLSQYRNLLHAYIHQCGAERASTFWSGCGAIKRILFLEHAGFSEQFGRPAIEDIELGYRLIRAGRKITLDRAIQVTHLKRWTFWNLVKTDILDRGIPWTELILRDHFMPNDLNLHLSQRVSVVLVLILVALSFVTAISWGGYFLIPLFTIVFVLLARWWIEFATPERPRNASVMLVLSVLLIAVFAWRHKMFGIIPPLLISPVLLFIRHRYAGNSKRRNVLRLFAIGYTVLSLCASALYLPANRLIFVCVGLLATLGLMNSQFYLFLAGNRGVPFMLAAIPFHILYHFYNGISFILGTVSYSWNKLTARWRRDPVVGSSPVPKPEV